MLNRRVNLGIAIVTFVLTCLGLSACKEDPTSPKVSKAKYKIAYNTIRNGSMSICTMNDDGTNQLQLTADTLWSYYPEWSPDGKKIAFIQRGRYTPHQVYTMNADGSMKKFLADSSGIDYTGRAIWSPDAKKILFSGSGELTYVPGDAIYIMNADGSDRTLLCYGATPTFSPDGNTIAYVAVPTGAPGG